jgi:hypothetical protein
MLGRSKNCLKEMSNRYYFSCSSEKKISYKIAELNGKYLAHSIESSSNHNHNFMALFNIGNLF